MAAHIDIHAHTCTHRHAGTRKHTQAHTGTRRSEMLQTGFVLQITQLCAPVQDFADVVPHDANQTVNLCLCLGKLVVTFPVRTREGWHGCGVGPVKRLLSILACVQCVQCVVCDVRAGPFRVCVWSGKGACA